MFKSVLVHRIIPLRELTGSHTMIFIISCFINDILYLIVQYLLHYYIDVTALCKVYKMVSIFKSIREKENNIYFNM